MNKKNFLRMVLILLAVFLLLVSCTAGPNEMERSVNHKGSVAGFWRGLWHGIIAPVAFVLSLFSRNISLYEVHNSGGWYDFGFILGLMIIFGGSSGGAGSRFRSRRRR